MILTVLNEDDLEISYATGEKGCACAMESAGEMGYETACFGSPMVRELDQCVFYAMYVLARSGLVLFVRCFFHA